MQAAREIDLAQYRILHEPFYADVSGEVGLFTVAAERRLPVMLKGPTGCGKTRFVQYIQLVLNAYSLFAKYSNLSYIYQNTICSAKASPLYFPLPLGGRGSG